MAVKEWFINQYLSITSWFKSPFARLVNNENPINASEVDQGIRNLMVQGSGFDKVAAWWSQLGFWYKLGLVVTLTSLSGLIGLAFEAPILMVGFALSVSLLIGSLLQSHHQSKLQVGKVLTEHFKDHSKKQEFELNEMTESLRVAIDTRNKEVDEIKKNHDFLAKETEEFFDKVLQDNKKLHTENDHLHQSINTLVLEKKKIEDRLNLLSKTAKVAEEDVKKRSKENQETLKQLSEKIETLLKKSPLEKQLDNKEWQAQVKKTLKQGHMVLEGFNKANQNSEAILTRGCEILSKEKLHHKEFQDVAEAIEKIHEEQASLIDKQSLENKKQIDVLQHQSQQIEEIEHGVKAQQAELEGSQQLCIEQNNDLIKLENRNNAFKAQYKKDEMFLIDFVKKYGFGTMTPVTSYKPEDNNLDFSPKIH